MKEQDDVYNLQRQEYEREIKHLRQLLFERQENIDLITEEKKWVNLTSILWLSIYIQ